MESDAFFGMMAPSTLVKSLLDLSLSLLDVWMGTGEWRDDSIHGRGIYFQQNGKKAFGKFSKGKLKGQAFFIFSNGTFLDAFVKDEQLNGEILVYSSQSRSWRISEFIEGIDARLVESGRGVPSGFKHFQEEIRPKYEQIATKPQKKQRPANQYNSGVSQEEENDAMIRCLQFEDGGKYFGSLRHGRPNGLGLLMYPDQMYDAGVFRDGIINGFGVIHFKGNDWFNGFIQNGKMDGDGLYYSASRKKWIMGRFQQNRMTREYSSGASDPIPEVRKWNKEGHLRSNYLINQRTSVVLLNGVGSPVMESPKRKREKEGTKRSGTGNSGKNTENFMRDFESISLTNSKSITSSSLLRKSSLGKSQERKRMPMENDGRKDKGQVSSGQQSYLIEKSRLRDNEWQLNAAETMTRSVGHVFLRLSRSPRKLDKKDNDSSDLSMEESLESLMDVQNIYKCPEKREKVKREKSTRGKSKENQEREERLKRKGIGRAHV